MTTRTVLKNYFRAGAIPKASEFTDLIESVLIKDEDNLLKSPNDPLGIRATGAEEGLLNFYRVVQSQDQLTWQLKQKQGEREGLSINNGSGGASRSRLFIDSTTGNIGVGTPDPGNYKLKVQSGDTYLGGALTTTGITHLGNGLTVSGTTTLNNKVIITSDGNVGIGTTDPGSSNLKITNSEKTDFANVWFSGTGMGQLDIVGWKNGENRGWNINTKTDGTHLYLNRDASSNSNVLIGRSGNELLVKGSNGNVGIGTTDPGAYKLNVAGDTNVTGNLNVTGTIKQTPWIEVPTLLNGWRNFEAIYNTAAYFKDSLGIVHLKGFLRPGTFDWDTNAKKWRNEVAIFTLPNGFKPAKQEVHIVATSNAVDPIKFGRLDILADGQVRPGFGEIEWFSLDGITFRAA